MKSRALLSCLSLVGKLDLKSIRLEFQLPSGGSSEQPPGGINSTEKILEQLAKERETAIVLKDRIVCL